MSTAYIIYDKYANAINNELLETGHRDSIHIDAVRLALRLALDELAASTPSTPSTPSISLQTAGYDALAEQLIRLNNWCAHHAPAALNGPGSTADVVLAVLDSYAQQIDRQAEELRQAADPASHDDRIAALQANLKAVDADNALLRSQLDAMRDAAQSLAEDKRNLQTEFSSLSGQLAQLDTDNAALIRRNKELSDELKHARLDRQESAFSGISATITDHPNGTAVTIAPAPINHQITLDYSSLSSENVDWCDGLDADRQQWRHLPKRTRLELVRWILSHDAAMTMAAFDASRPEWMPTAGSHCKTFNMTWEQLNDFTVDLEVTR